MIRIRFYESNDLDQISYKQGYNVPDKIQHMTLNTIREELLRIEKTNESKGTFHEG